MELLWFENGNVSPLVGSVLSPRRIYRWISELFPRVGGPERMIAWSQSKIYTKLVAMRLIFGGFDFFWCVFKCDAAWKTLETVRSKIVYLKMAREKTSDRICPQFSWPLTTAKIDNFMTNCEDITCYNGENRPSIILERKNWLGAQNPSLPFIELINGEWTQEFPVMDFVYPKTS